MTNNKCPSDIHYATFVQATFVPVAVATSLEVLYFTLNLPQLHILQSQIAMLLKSNLFLGINTFILITILPLLVLILFYLLYYSEHLDLVLSEDLQGVITEHRLRSLVSLANVEKQNLFLKYTQ